MPTKTGFYEQHGSILHIIENANGKTLSVHCWATGAHFLWESLPKDAKFLGTEYAGRAVQNCIKSFSA